LEATAKVNDGCLYCSGCNNHFGIASHEVLIFRHKVFCGQRASFGYLIAQALYERINESCREIHIGYIQIKLLRWGNFVYKKDKFVRCINVGYRKTVYLGAQLPEKDLLKLYKNLQKFNKKLPESTRKIGDWKISIIITD
jgi:hypothetical protein